MLIADLLRHGELEGGVKYRGTVDDPLTEAGRFAMDGVWTKLQGKVDLIVASPLTRCAEPAKEWATQAGIDCLIDERVVEMRYGAWEGKTSTEIRAEFPGMLERWRADPTGQRPPGGESPEELRARLTDWWQEARELHEGKRMLVVAHSGSLRMLLAIALGAPISTTRQIDMPYACWSRIAANERHSWLMHHNLTD